ncbi:Sec-independent protein translocase protein TatB [Halomonas chromatireducens]|uniref:Sec-independent protein translocase protein TatB n=1 Tax=Halomonas chromatireducens TaxID=507626 RepID=A0A109UMR3_9GAMM|nr:Sec-independent protein translocase protein TatB [Halomonas chromatireducens]AMD01998.1 Sec-independent protein translocase protein TatB [Halomonas chromatireducens]
MFDIGFLELLILGVVGLLVLGPERLPKAARTVGLWVGKIKRSVSSMQREISSQLEAEELRQKLKEQQSKLDESLDRAKRDVESIAKPYSTSTPSRHANEKAEPDSPAGEQPPPQAAARLDDALANARQPDERPADERSTPPDDDKKDAASR